jgi:hypothetical protein
MPYPHELLKLARELVDRNPAAPVEVDLRRGVSTAYYALFHLLVFEATEHLIAVPALRPRVARSFDHRIMKTVCGEYASPSPNPPGQPPGPAAQVLRAIAVVFIQLQSARHLADYDFSVTMTQPQAVNDVKKAETAFQDWDTVRTDPAALTFLAELLCRGIPRR